MIERRQTPPPQYQFFHDVFHELGEVCLVTSAGVVGVKECGGGRGERQRQDEQQRRCIQAGEGVIQAGLVAGRCANGTVSLKDEGQKVLIPY